MMPQDVVGVKDFVTINCAWVTDLQTTDVFGDDPILFYELSGKVASRSFVGSRFEQIQLTCRQWLKCHLMIGVKTHVVTSVEITGKEGSDFNQLWPLVENTAKRFEMAEDSADKGYISNKSFEAITAAGATPYIPFKSNTTGERTELWRKMFHLYQFNRAEFLEKYHKRSNVESTFSMIKAKFGASVRSKKRVAQVNEILCKVLCHNLSVLVHSIYELGLEPTFWAEKAPAQKVDAIW